jgi:hypothetical protein
MQDEPKIDINSLEEMLKDAKKGIAKVHKKYVNYDEKGHLFSYNIDFKRFLENITYIINKGKTNANR